MAQLSLYLDDATMASVRKEAKRRKTSLSKYVSKIISERNDGPRYPEGFFALYGCLADVDICRPEDDEPTAVQPLFA